MTTIIYINLFNNDQYIFFFFFFFFFYLFYFILFFFLFFFYFKIIVDKIPSKNEEKNPYNCTCDLGIHILYKLFKVLIILL